MGLARDLVDLEARIRQRADLDVFAPLKRGDGSLAVPEVAAVIDQIRPTDAQAVLRLCVQALRIQYEELSPKLLDAELVATLPPESPGIARPTGRVIRELVSNASREIILVGYELTDMELVTLLAAATSRGSDVIVICDRARGAATRIVESWPMGVRLPRIFQDRERSTNAPYASMHAKCLLVDSAQLLITSANFTFHGLHGNIEIGVRLGGAPAGEARKIFSHLVEDKIVEEVGRQGIAR